MATHFQCSCLENPRDGRAWWAAVYGVAQSWTQLKRLNSSNPWTESARELQAVTLDLSGFQTGSTPWYSVKTNTNTKLLKENLSIPGFREPLQISFQRHNDQRAD